MKIAVYHNQPPGGARRALHGFCSVLARRHRLDVFTLATADQSMLHDADYASNMTTLPFETSRPIRGGFLFNDIRHAQDLARLDTVNREAADLIDAGAYDVALVDACRFTFAPQVLRHLRTPSVYYCHHGPWRTEGIAERVARSVYENVRHAAHAPLRQRIDRQIRNQEGDLMRHARTVATNSQYTRTRVREIYGIDGVACPPGISIPPLRSPHESDYILNVGDLVPHKGHDLVIEALATVPAKLRPSLHIVGHAAGRTYRDRIQRRAQELGIRVVIRQGISDAELEDEYQGACFYIYGARQEPLGLAPLEAMARSLAVLAVREGGVVETVDDGVTGFLVPAHPAVMGERCARLLRDAGLRARMGAAGRQAVEKLWSREARTAALESVLGYSAAAAQPLPA
jgi:glycosyltransferase involved in cell wall biosynthesis